MNKSTSSRDQALANLLYPDVDRDVQDILNQYPRRQLDSDALVTRFGPSPTGFMHIGGVMTALLNWKLATQSGGVFILRIEDTDRQREIQGGTKKIVESLQTMGLAPCEGPVNIETLDEKGEYGPYRQSERLAIYHAFAKQLVRDGHAYPCFLTPEELQDIRNRQQEKKLTPGVYGEWAKYRVAPLSLIEEKLNSGEEFVLRLKPSHDDPEQKILVNDYARGKLKLPENTLDMVLIKSDGYPTYHFAHPIDDSLMGVNLIIRGDEWISTTPVHVQLFDFMRLEMPRIAHIAPIAKLDGRSRRKLSKRKDDEASMDFYHEAGYEPQAIIEYLMNLLDSGFEDWRGENPQSPWQEYTLAVDNLGKSSSLFDIDKLNNIARDIMVRMTPDTRYEHALRWCTQHDPGFAEVLTANPAFSRKVLNIGVQDETPRKDVAHWSEAPDVYGYFFADVFARQVPSGYAEMPALDTGDRRDILQFALDNAGPFIEGDKESFLARTREYAGASGYALKNKDKKQNPEAFKGTWGDILMLLRVALTGRKRTPDLHGIMQILGEAEVNSRIRLAIEHCPTS